MNHILNDNGETVIAVGAPGSLARIETRYPNLIYRLNRFHEMNMRRDDALTFAKMRGVPADELATVMQVSKYGK